MNARTEATNFAPAVTQQTVIANLSIKDAVLAQFKEAEVIITTLAEKYRDVAYDVATAKGMKEAISARADLRDNGRLFVTKSETRIKGEVNDLKKVMSVEVERLVSIVKPVEDFVDGQIKAEEQRKAAEKAERDRITAEKAAVHQAKITKIKACADNAKGISSERIKNGIAMVEALSFGSECEDFLPQYEKAKAETLMLMRAHLIDSQAREEAESRRLENERVAAELAAQREALEAQAAELKRQQEAAQAARVAQTHAIVLTFPEPQPVAQEAARMEREAVSKSQDTARQATPEPVQAPAISAPQPEPTIAPAPAAVVHHIRPAAKAEEPTLKLGEICARLGMTVTASFLADTLGIHHSATDKAAKLYCPSDFARICDALIAHIQKAKAGELQAA